MLESLQNRMFFGVDDSGLVQFWQFGFFDLFVISCPVKRLDYLGKKTKVNSLLKLDLEVQGVQKF